MKKKIAAIILLSMMIMGVVSAASINGEYKKNPIVIVKSNGKIIPIKTGVPALTYHGHGMVPISVLSQVGMVVKWDQKTFSVDIQPKPTAAPKTPNMKALLDKVGGSAVYKNANNKSYIEVDFTQLIDYETDWVNLDKMFSYLSNNAYADYITINYIQNGKIHGILTIDSKSYRDYIENKITDDKLDWILSGRLFEPVMSIKDIAKLTDRVGFVNVFDSSNTIIGFGSGFMIEGGYFITNHHVAIGGGGISVRLDGVLYDPHFWYYIVNEERDVYGVILSTSYDSNGRGTGSFPSKTLKYSIDMPEVGDKVFAIGSPNGFENTFSEGIVSGIRTFDGVQYIQHTADTESGSSGGVLLNEYGEAIGITTSGVPNTTQDFAVPMKYVAEELSKK